MLLFFLFARYIMTTHRPGKQKFLGSSLSRDWRLGRSCLGALQDDLHTLHLSRMVKEGARTSFPSLSLQTVPCGLLHRNWSTVRGIIKLYI